VIVYAQEVEHNYPVGPQSTNCDSLQLNGLPVDKMIQIIKNSAFRFDQQFKISRLSGIRGGNYYSCDGKSGFLMVDVDKEIELYVDVPKSTWDEFLLSPDLDGFYERNIKNSYKQIEE
jgi:hypothetical protein